MDKILLIITQTISTRETFSIINLKRQQKQHVMHDFYITMNFSLNPIFVYNFFDNFQLITTEFDSENLFDDH